MSCQGKREPTSTTGGPSAAEIFRAPSDMFGRFRIWTGQGFGQVRSEGNLRSQAKLVYRSQDAQIPTTTPKGCSVTV